MSATPDLATCRCIGCGVAVALGSRSLAAWYRLDGYLDFGLCSRCVDSRCQEHLRQALGDHLAQRRAYTPEQEIEAAR